MDCQIPANGGKPLAQFFPIAPVAPISITAEPPVAMCLRDCSPCPDRLPAFAARARPGAHTSSNRRNAGGKLSPWGSARWRAASRVPSMSKTIQFSPFRSTSPPVCLSGVRGRASKSLRKSVRRASTGASVSAAKNCESAEREGNRSRSNNAHVREWQTVEVAGRTPPGSVRH